MNLHRLLHDETTHPERILQGRERQHWRRARCNLRRLTWLEAQTAYGAVASDAEVAAWDARLAEIRAALLGTPVSTEEPQ